MNGHQPRAGGADAGGGPSQAHRGDQMGNPSLSVDGGTGEIGPGELDYCVTTKSPPRKVRKIFVTIRDGYSAGVELQNHADDFVGSWIGRNPATYDKRPERSSSFREGLRMLIDAANVHTCYGTGSANKDCIPNYGKAPTMVVQP